MACRRSDPPCGLSFGPICFAGGAGPGDRTSSPIPWPCCQEDRRPHSAEAPSMLWRTRTGSPPYDATRWPCAFSTPATGTLGMFSMSAPCSVKTRGMYFLCSPRPFFKVAICDLKASFSSLFRTKAKSSGKRSMFLFTCSLSRLTGTPYRAARSESRMTRRPRRMKIVRSTRSGGIRPRWCQEPIPPEGYRNRAGKFQRARWEGAASAVGAETKPHRASRPKPDRREAAPPSSCWCRPTV